MERIIFDTDLALGAPGSEIDDGFALALAHADPDIQIDMITTVSGNIDVESATILSLDLRRRLGIEDVPVIKGASASFCHPEVIRQASPHVVANFGLGLKPNQGVAAIEIARHVMANPGQITILAIGPLTNIATALVVEPAIAKSVKQVVIMGGVFLGATGFQGMPGEFNVWSDPESAAAVLRSGAPMRWVGLDVTLKVRLTREHAKRLLKGPGSFGPLAGESALAWMDLCRDADPGDPLLRDSCAMHDPLAVAAVTHPHLLEWRPAAVSIVTGDGIARGVMITDLLHAASPPNPNCEIATEVDAVAFTELFVRALSTI